MNKIIFGLVAIIVVIGAVVLLQGQSKTEQLSKPSSVSQTTASPSTSGENQALVTITSSGFEPKTLTVKAGTKVIWKNTGNGISDVSSDVHPTHELYPPLNLGDIESGQTVSLVFDKPGTYKYHNHLDAAQEGVVEVTE